MLRVAVPNKGALSESAAEILMEAGYRRRSDPKDLTCGYRDEAVVHRTVECGLGTVAARLDPLFVLKT